MFWTREIDIPSESALYHSNLFLTVRSLRGRGDKAKGLGQLI
jgi:hypothetical protein